MSNPVVLITGALTGIGRATALAFANEGARIVVSGRRDEAVIASKVFFPTGQDVNARGLSRRHIARAVEAGTFDWASLVRAA